VKVVAPLSGYITFISPTQVSIERCMMQSNFERVAI